MRCHICDNIIDNPVDDEQFGGIEPCPHCISLSNVSDDDDIILLDLASDVLDEISVREFLNSETSVSEDEQ